MKKDICERTFRFAVRVVKLCKVLDKTVGVSRTLANQLLRAGTSVGANVEEAQGGQSKADFASKMMIALKEARETHYWLSILTATEIMPEDQLTPLKAEATEHIPILTVIIKTAKENA